MEIIEVRDSMGHTWFVKSSDVVAAVVVNNVMRIHIRDIAQPVGLEIHPQKADKAFAVARMLVKGEFKTGMRIISESASF